MIWTWLRERRSVNIRVILYVPQRIVFACYLVRCFKGPPSPQKIPIFAKNEIKDSIGLIYAYYGAAPAIGLAD